MDYQLNSLSCWDIDMLCINDSCSIDQASYHSKRLAPGQSVNYMETIIMVQLKLKT